MTERAHLTNQPFPFAPSIFCTVERFSNAPNECRQHLDPQPWPPLAQKPMKGSVPQGGVSTRAAAYAGTTRVTWFRSTVLTVKRVLFFTFTFYLFTGFVTVLYACLRNPSVSAKVDPSGAKDLGLGQLRGRNWFDTIRGRPMASSWAGVWTWTTCVRWI